MIAISYRREDSLPVAGRLYDRLQGEFGQGNIFMDFDSIPYGVDFRDHIQHMVEGSQVLVAIIGPDWAGKRRRKFRRIDEEADFVRLEIAYALARNVPIIPILIGKTAMPKASELPPDIESLAYRNAMSLDVGVDFHHHAERLITTIKKLLRDKDIAPSVPAAKSADSRITTASPSPTATAPSPATEVIASSVYTEIDGRDQAAGSARGQSRAEASVESGARISR